MIKSFIINNYLAKEFLKTVFNMSLGFFSLGFIINLFEEINFFKDYDVGIYLPIILSFIYVPSLFYNMFPFVILLSGIWFFLNIKRTDEITALKVSGLNYTIVRPNGFFSDMKDFLQMAKSGRVYLFGSGNQKFNPIHGEDLARAILDTLDEYNKEFTIGGPDVFSLNEISGLALQALEKPVKIVHLPDCLRTLTIWSLRTFTSVKTYGPIEFFLTLMAEDAIAPTYGKHHLEDFYIVEG